MNAADALPWIWIACMLLMDQYPCGFGNVLLQVIWDKLIGRQLLWSTLQAMITMCYCLLGICRTPIRGNLYGTVSGRWCRHTRIIGRGWWQKETMRLKTFLSSWKAFCPTTPAGKCLTTRADPLPISTTHSKLQGFTFWCWDLMPTSIQILHSSNGFRCLSTSHTHTHTHSLSLSLSPPPPLFLTQKFRTMMAACDVVSLFVWS